MSDTQTAPGYLALPAAGTGPGVLVLHAWWGLTGVIKDVCDRLAVLGFVAYAPDLYHGQLATTIAEAERLGKELDRNAAQAKAETREAVNKLLAQVGDQRAGIGVVGFSLGAYYALQLSGDDPTHVRTVVLFYGTGDGDFAQAQATYQGHFAENDPYEPAEAVAWLESALQSAGRSATLYRYEGVGHWFFEPDRADAYNEAAATLAWERTVAFLRSNLTQTNKAELLRGLQEEYQNWLTLLDEIGPAHMEHSGVAGPWSIKDIVAHLTGWRRRTVGRLQALQRGEPEPSPPWPTHLQTDDEINAWIYQSRQGYSVREVLDESNQVFQALTAAIQGLPEEVLAVAHRLPWMEGRPFSAAEFFGHFHEEHEPEMRAWLAQGEQK